MALTIAKLERYADSLGLTLKQKREKYNVLAGFFIDDEWFPVQGGHQQVFYELTMSKMERMAWNKEGSK